MDQDDTGTAFAVKRVRRTDRVLRVNTIWNRFNLAAYDFTGAACANPDYDPEWWTIDGNSRALRSRVHVNNWMAKKICATCSIKLQCFEVALRNPELFGVWGGTTDTERALIRDRRKIKPTGTGPA